MNSLQFQVEQGRSQVLKKRDVCQSYTLSQKFLKKKKNSKQIELSIIHLYYSIFENFSIVYNLFVISKSIMISNCYLCVIYAHSVKRAKSIDEFDFL